ncbi:MAG TPA: NAD(P)-binding protein, partial [Polyangiales bacterium]|nr:NAD(P)-binding protein [Polyangiales bacterium]
MSERERDRRPLRILRRDFVRGAAASGPLLWLGGRVHADAPAAADDPCSSGVPLPALESGIGLRLRETMAGTVGGAAFAFELELVIADLRQFLAASAPEAEITAGVVRWVGHAEQASVRAGRVRSFAQCEPARAHKRFDFELDFSDDQGRVIALRGEKLLQEERGFDPATDLSRMSVVLQHAGRELARGELRADRGELLTRLHTVQVEGTLDRAQIEAARRAYLEYMNRQCAGCYPQLPKLVSQHGTLTPEEWRALSLVLRVMLPMPLPDDGPSAHDVIENLERFLHHADAATFAGLRAQVGQLGAVAPLAGGHVPELQRFVHQQLKQPGYSELKSALDSLHKLAVLGYYSHPKSYRKLDYQPLPVVPLRRTLLPVRSRPSARVFDVAIVGSGVAGSLLAERLTAAGKSVVVLESGPYVPEMTIDADELGWLARLERGSGLQQANASGPLARSSRSFPVLQGHCVGGGGVINNAVCFQLPVAQLEQWRGVGFPVAPEALRAGYAAV